MKSEVIGCCDDFKKAQSSGTDNEMYGALISFFMDNWNAGCGLSSLYFCPWCGFRLSDLPSKGLDANG